MVHRAISHRAATYHINATSASIAGVICVPRPVVVDRTALQRGTICINATAVVVVRISDSQIVTINLAIRQATVRAGINASAIYRSGTHHCVVANHAVRQLAVCQQIGSSSVARGQTAIPYRETVPSGGCGISEGSALAQHTLHVLAVKD